MRKPSNRLNHIVPAASVMRAPSRRRPPVKTKMYAAMKGTTITIKGG